MSLGRARSANEYREWVRQAVFEGGDLRHCLGYEIGGMAKSPVVLDPLEQGIKCVHQAMRDGTHVIDRGDLSFTDLAARYPEEMPFHSLLKQNNETHPRGLNWRFNDE
jgi:hypothetical protein